MGGWRFQSVAGGRAPRPGAVIERSTGPPLARRLTAHAAIHSFISLSLHLPTLLSIHVSDLSSVHPIIAPGIIQTRQPWLSPLSPACQSCLPRSPRPPTYVPRSGPSLFCQEGRSTLSTSVALRFCCSVIARLPLLTTTPPAATNSPYILHSTPAAIISQLGVGSLPPTLRALPGAWWLLREGCGRQHISSHCLSVSPGPSLLQAGVRESGNGLEGVSWIAVPQGLWVRA